MKDGLVHPATLVRFIKQQKETFETNSCYFKKLKQPKQAGQGIVLPNWFSCLLKYKSFYALLNL